MSISPEDFGISERDQLEIRFNAVRGALVDVVKIKKTDEPSLSEAEHADAAVRIDQVVEEIMADSGVSELEARLILVEQLLLSKTEGENNGEDF